MVVVLVVGFLVFFVFYCFKNFVIVLIKVDIKFKGLVLFIEEEFFKYDGFDFNVLVYLLIFG